MATVPHSKSVEINTRGLLFYFLILLTILFLAVSCTGFLVLLSEGRLNSESIAFFVVIAILAAVSAFFAWRIGRARMEISSNGITCMDSKGQRSIQWRNVKCVGLLPNGGGVVIEVHDGQQMKLPRLAGKASEIFGLAVDWELRNNGDVYRRELSATFPIPFEKKSFSDGIILLVVLAFAGMSAGTQTMLFIVVVALGVPFMLFGRLWKVRIAHDTIEVASYFGRSRIPFDQIRDAKLGISNRFNDGELTTVRLELTTSTGKQLALNLNGVAWKDIYVYVCDRIGKLSSLPSTVHTEFEERFIR